MAFPPHFLDEIRARVPLEDVIGKRVRLARRGRELIGLCPFHNEKTPSFTVSPEKAFYHCFGCGAHGDVIGFVMRDEGLGFPEAVERLAGQAGIPVPRESPEAQARNRERRSLFEVTEAACVWFQRRLGAPEGAAARRYLEGRGVTPDMVEAFRLGFAPARRDGLKGALAQQGIAETLQLAAGLLVEPEGQGAPYDRFRGRIMFPIGDRRGRVIGFGGRAMGDAQPKYLNSPETSLFHKSIVLYGVAHAAPAVRKGARLVAVEGYMDVIALHQAGITGAVAPLGTALTEGQLEEMWRLADEPVLCFDGDAAGARAAGRAAERALPGLRAGRGLRFARLPDGHDPDTLVRAGGAAAMAALIEDAIPLSMQLWDMATGGRVPTEPEARARVSHWIGERVARIPDRDLRFYYTNFVRDRLRAPFGGAARRDAARGERAHAEPAQGLGRHAGRASEDPERRERALLQTLLNFPELIQPEREALGTMRLVTAPYRALMEALMKWADGRSAAAPADISPDAYDALHAWLAEHGFGPRVAQLLAAPSLEWASRRTRASLGDARLQLRQALQLHHQSRLLAAREEAVSALAEEMSEANWERLQQAMEAAREAGHVEADVPGFGAPNILPDRR